MAVNHHQTPHDKLIQAAADIVNNIAHSDSAMADDLLQTFSTFDSRLSRQNLSHQLLLRANANAANPAPSPFDDSLRSLDRQISRLSASSHPLWSDPGDAAAFLDALDDLRSFILEWSPLADDKPVALSLQRADDLLHTAMSRLEAELQTMLQQGGDGDGDGYYSDQDEVDNEGEEIPVARPVTDYNIVIEVAPPRIVGDLYEIAKRMVVAGYEKECFRAYGGCRRDFLDESLSRLGLRKITSVDEVQRMEWSEMEEEIEKWTKASNVALRILFPSERRLCERVFFGSPAASDFSFMEVCKASTVQLLCFAEGVAMNSRSPERLFKVLDMYETVRDLLAEFEFLFSNQYCVGLRREAVAVWKRLGESIRGIFMELENLIRRDPAKISSTAGGAHPITRYVMNYIRAACKSRGTLEQVFEEGVVVAGGGSFSAQILWIVDLLESNLEAKARIYKDVALSSVFMMNNGRYIIDKVRDSELGELLGEDWIRKHNAKERQFHVNYQRSSWSRVVAALKVDGVSVGSDMGNMNLKEKIKVFNTVFDEICGLQSSWVVSDDELKEEMKGAIAGSLVPAYRNFLVRFRSAPETGRNANRYLRYSVEEVEARIMNDLFQGRGGRQ